MIAIIVILGLRAPLFFKPGNLMTVLKQSGVLCMTAISITTVLIVGGFDMGAGASVQLVCNLAAGLLISYANPAISWVAGIAVGALFGLVNACLVVFVHIPTFVTTLGTMYVMNGVTALYNGGSALAIKSIPGYSFDTGEYFWDSNYVYLGCGCMFRYEFVFQKDKNQDCECTHVEKIKRQRSYMELKLESIWFLDM